MQSGFLTHPIETLAQAIALGHQPFATLGVDRHRIQRFLQLQARFAYLFLLQRALLGQFGKLFIQPTAT
ncbi:hypothetical protein D3C80_1578520 [compost metagenome]